MNSLTWSFRRQATHSPGSLGSSIVDPPENPGRGLFDQSGSSMPSARLLRQHRALILDYIPRSKAPIHWCRWGPEQQNKSHYDKSYGFRIFRALELALYHSLGNLPEPESTHDSF
jgi:hypothetical protein